ncbi:MAG: AMP-binding protein [Oscillospiraceae bacterium]|jgi:amino acid adenylation domain-containing protein|nr:AMP-binding protein [Oscillospiraceae bacterium]
MQRNLLEYLENSAKEFPDKTAFSDGKKGLTFEELLDLSKAAGCSLLEEGFAKEPIAVLMDKSPAMAAAFLAVLYSGGCYVPLDREMSANRIKLILETLKPRAMIVGEKTTAGFARTLKYDGEIYSFEELSFGDGDDEILDEARERALDTDPAYIVYTSGSTGIPKGVAASHRNVIDYIEALGEVLQADGGTIFGNQSPLYLDACLKDFYTTLKFAAETVFIPKTLFSFPVKLIGFLNEHKINTVCWVVSVFTYISGVGALESVQPKFLRTAAFGSEVFPAKQLRLWREALPDTRFINLYGPTECTGMSCFYEVDREFDDDEAVPIGKAFPNTAVTLLDDDGQLIEDADVPGEIYISGAGVTYGYYGDFERTEQAFVQNPLNSAYREIVYKTGDLARYNEYGELVYISRRDQQIKHMGYRIELAEIEAAAAGLDGAALVCCVFDSVRSLITLYYTGTIEEPKLKKQLKELLPGYMLPSAVERLDEFPSLSSGKIDRKTLTDKAIERNV